LDFWILSSTIVATINHVHVTYDISKQL